MTSLGFWKRFSITKKLYIVVGTMAILIAGELVVLGFAIDTLAAVRAFIEGEGTWSKAQKNAVFHLQRYAFTGNVDDYQTFVSYLQVYEGDGLARRELLKPKPDYDLVRQGFIQGKIYPSDIPSIVRLIQRFDQVSYVKNAMNSWSQADQMMARLYELAREYHELALSGKSESKRAIELVQVIESTNETLTQIETEFSASLAAGARWLEDLVLSILFLVVLTVETIGLTLTFVTSRALGRDLKNIGEVAKKIGDGDYSARAEIRSQDEVGRLAESLNGMGELLEQSYEALEQRVKKRTDELNRALRARDQFLSIASHELRTPLSSLSLQIQLRGKKARAESFDGFTTDQWRKMVEDDERQMTRLIRLVGDMLDTSRIQTGLFSLQVERVELVTLVRTVIERIADRHMDRIQITTNETNGALSGIWDPFRLEQVIANLLTNAFKYGGTDPILIDLERRGENVVMSFTDHGIGIDPKDFERIFEPFERVAPATIVAGGMGLGLHIVKGIVQAHGGTIEVVSQLGRGTTFSVTLPTRSKNSSIRSPLASEV